MKNFCSNIILKNIWLNKSSKGIINHYFCLFCWSCLILNNVIVNKSKSIVQYNLANFVLLKMYLVFFYHFAIYLKINFVILKTADCFNSFRNKYLVKKNKLLLSITITISLHLFGGNIKFNLFSITIELIVLLLVIII